MTKNERMFQNMVEAGIIKGVTIDTRMRRAAKGQGSCLTFLFHVKYAVGPEASFQGTSFDDCLYDAMAKARDLVLKVVNERRESLQEAEGQLSVIDRAVNGVTESPTPREIEEEDASTFEGSLRQGG